MAEKTNAKAGKFAELGVAGTINAFGEPEGEFLRELRGDKGRKVYREMADNDPTVGAILAAFDRLLRSVDWRSEPVDDSPEAVEQAEFLASVKDDMSGTWEEFISEALTMLVFGWSYFEVVLKRRLGPDQAKPQNRSRHEDGRIGIRKLAPRPQMTLDRWQVDEDGGIQGMWQWPQTVGAGGRVFIPIDRALLFRTTAQAGNPEGRSILRNCYKPWYFQKQIAMSEAIGLERDLRGLPVIRIPGEYLKEDADAAKKAALEKYKKIARDLRFNEQAGVVIPSDLWKDQEGKLTDRHLVEIELLGSASQRIQDTSKVLERYAVQIARSVLADFIMLGANKQGSYALSKDKTDLFRVSLECVLAAIAAVINRHLVPRLWALNGLPRDLMPRLKPEDVAPADLEALGSFIERLTRAGAPLFPDEALQAHLRAAAGLPQAEVEE